ncbi:MAG: peptidoglycan editing factor PgeF [Chloroflexota bacterium]
MQRIQHQNGVITYTFDSLTMHPINAHITTRHGGVSPAPWNTLNFSISRGDTPERVAQNRALLAEALGINSEDMVRTHQTHGTTVAKVDWSDANQWQESTDGVITDTIGLPLALVFADCVPILFYDPVHHVLGACHAGWRGTVNGMATATLWAMQAAYDTAPSDVMVGIGPSIGPDSYEVGAEVWSMAQAKLPNADDLFSYPNGTEANPYFDLWQANASLLVANGVQAAHIEVAGIDTAQHTGDFFSHRAEKGRCGLFGMVAWLNPV